MAQRLPNLFSLEMWGGATFDTSMRFLHEDPWQRLRELRRRIPNICFQMLLRGANAVGYTSYPDNVIVEFVREAHRQGIDIFRIFDSLNSIENMRVSIDAVLETGAVCEPAICYTGDMFDKDRPKYSLKYYVKMAKHLEKLGAHFLAIKDMAGVCRPYAAFALVKALREEVGIPIHFHTHDTSGVNSASLLKAAGCRCRCGRRGDRIHERRHQPAESEFRGRSPREHTARHATRHRRTQRVFGFLGDRPQLLSAV